MSDIENISPIDGRYRNLTLELKSFFSEFALQKYRIKVEIEYFICLCENFLKLNLSELDNEELRNIYNKFNYSNSIEIKKIEEKTNHDVKAVEYYIKSLINNQTSLEKFINYKEYIHFALTSQDINSVSYSLMMIDCLDIVLRPTLNKLSNKIEEIGKLNINIPMLSRTHGQSATPTTLGKEFLVFHERLNNQMQQLDSIKHTTKFGGATGNLNAHYFVDENIDWCKIFDKFINLFNKNLFRSQYTTQIDHYDNYSTLFDNLNRICVLLIDFNVDIWYYISLNYFGQKVIKGEVGSSTMPHKINPINFENAEGNFYLASNLLQFFSRKLPISRLQRDLTDSTITRNIGVAFSHMLIALKSCLKGLNKLTINKNIIEKDLENNYLIVTEGIQTFLRHKNISNPYEKIKEIVRKENIDNNKIMIEIKEYIDSLDLLDTDKNKLKSLMPNTYIGKID